MVNVEHKVQSSSWHFTIPRLSFTEDFVFPVMFFLCSISQQIKMRLFSVFQSVKSLESIWIKKGWWVCSGSFTVTVSRSFQNTKLDVHIFNRRKILYLLFCLQPHQNCFSTFI